MTDGDVKKRQYKFDTDTRISQCLAMNCSHNLVDAEHAPRAVNCRLKSTSINERGACSHFEAIDDKG